MNRIIVLLLSILTASAANHYVLSAAVGSQNGADWINAYTNLPSSRIRGDTYFIGVGNYTPLLLNDAVSGTNLITIQKATIATHGTSVGWNDSFASPAVWTLVSGNLLHELVTGYYTIDGAYGNSDVAGSYGFRWSNGTRSRDADTWLLSSDGYGPISNLVSLTFKNIEFTYNNGTPATNDTGMTYCFASYCGVSDFVFQSNFLHHSCGVGLFLRSGLSSSYTGIFQTNITIADNWFFSNGGGGGSSHHWELLWLSQATNLVFKNNRIHNTFGGGQTGRIMIEALDHFYYYGNLMWDDIGATQDGQPIYSGNNGAIGTFTYAIPDAQIANAYVYNNTFVNVPFLKLDFSQSVGYTNITLKNNLYYGSTSEFDAVTLQSYDAFGGGMGSSGSNAQTGVANSIFVSYASGNFHLLLATLGGDSTIGSQFNLDPDGVTRGANGNWSRGAFNLSSVNLLSPILNGKVQLLGKTIFK